MIDVLVIADAPSSVKGGTPEIFSYSDMAVLRGMLQEVNINPANVQIITVRSKPINRFDPKAIRLLFDKWAAKTPSSELSREYAMVRDQIARYNPKVIIPVGNLALQAVTGEWSIDKWRGSQLFYNDGSTSIPLVPTYSPALINRDWALRAISLIDLRRASKAGSWTPPSRSFIVSPTLAQVDAFLDEIEQRARTISIKVAIDLETRLGHIACCGLAYDKTNAICIPFMKAGDASGYWSEHEEFHIVYRLRQLFKHPNIKWVLQNGNFDQQYFFRHWGKLLNMYMDTMLAHHVMWSGLPKSLDYISSMYCEYYRYWKDDGKKFDLEHHSEERLWYYNCEDCVTTFECSDVLDGLLDHFSARPQFDFQMRQAGAVLRMMLRGVRRDTDYQRQLLKELEAAENERQQWIESIVGHPLNIRSSKQMCEFFYKEIGLPEVRDRKSKNVSANDKALEQIWKKMPCVRPIVDIIKDIRSIGVFTSTFVEMQVDIDGRIRCSYNVAGTETFRYSSSENAFGSGGNLQNIPKGGAKSKTRFSLPNIRSMFIPDEGYVIIDCDLKSADAQVVAWEADDDWLKDLFRSDGDLHVENAKTIFNVQKVSDYQRKLAKMGVHLCLTEDHEVLTPKGWVPIGDKPGHIMCWNPETERLTWEEPLGWYDAVADTEFFEADLPGFSQKVTRNHKFAYKTDQTGYRVTTVQNLPESARLPKSGYFQQGTSTISPDEARLICAIQADGSRNKARWRFHLKKARKIERLHALLNRLGIEFSFVEYADGTTHTSFAAPDYSKELGSYILSWNAEALEAYVDEAPWWDGSRGNSGRRDIAAKSKEHLKWFATMVHLQGQASQIIPRGIPSGTAWAASINNRPFARNPEWKRTKETLRVVCPTTPTGFFLVRRNDVISVTGNTNYGGSPATLSKSLGITMAEAEYFQYRWFSAHPGIKAWHERTLNDLMTKRMVMNKFGFFRRYFDRIDGLLPQALAWVPQSTVALVIDHGLVNVDEQLPAVMNLLQVHDSLVMQAPKHMLSSLLPEIRRCLSITIPYDDPLVIGVGCEVSERSWGTVEKMAWPVAA